MSVSHHLLVSLQFVRERTINPDKAPVLRFSTAQDEGEGLGERGAVSIFGLDDDRFGFHHADEGLVINHFWGVVVHIQQPHGQVKLRVHLAVCFKRKSESIKNINWIDFTLLYNGPMVFSAQNLKSVVS